MPRPNTPSSIEALESRIAPANIFVSGTASGPNALKVVTETGANAQDTTAENDAQSAAGSTVAVLLAAGDKLIFDADGNHLVGPRDYVLMEVTAGSAMVFLTNNAAGKNIHAFEKNEISGLALSAGFDGVVHTDINGTVATALDGSGNFTAASGTLTLQGSSVAGLTIEGQIAGGHLLSGGNLNEVSIAGRHFNTKTPQLSVTGQVATGTAANGLMTSFNGGATQFATSYSLLPGVGGGDLRDLTLAFGTTALRTGDGGINISGPSAPGGSLVNVRVTSPVPVIVETGNGGTAPGNGTGGAGGSITHGDFVFTTTATAEVEFLLGNGGSSAFGTGGVGGSFTDVSLHLPKTAKSLTMQAGNGGRSGQGAKGGHGGGFDTLDLEVLALRGAAMEDKVLNVRAGDGGLGGSLGGAGGDGGSLLDIHYTSTKTAVRSLREFFQAGDGADGDAAAGGTGGAGGQIANATLILQGTASEVHLQGGNAGDAQTATGGAGASGGGVANVHIVVRSDAGDVFLEGGAGGNSGGAAAGTGGAVAAVTYANTGLKSGGLFVTGGDGGNATNSTGGDGGQVSGVTITNVGSVVGGFTISGGGHGNFTDTGAGSSSTGNGGDVSLISINNYGATGPVEIVSGGDSPFVDPISGNGDVGSSGSISSIAIHDAVGAFTDSNPFKIHTGLVTLLANGDSARGGDISNIHLNAPKSSFLIYGGDGAGSVAMNGAGGDAGDISGITGRVGKLTINAGNGGFSGNGTAGTGGSVFDVSLGYVGKFVQMISAGNGGNGVTAGAGGSVHDVSIAGAIGDFTKAFSLFEMHLDSPTGAVVGMGGLIAGQAGTGAGGAVNGSIANVTATRIAAILAGRPDPNAVDYTNAVTSISNVHANVIGADVNHNRVFNFTEGGANPGYQPNEAHDATDGDTAIDGFVLVKASGTPVFPVTPLMLIQV